MRVMGRLRGLLTGLLVNALCLCLSSEWAAGQVTPTPDQLQTFQGLTPEQQQAVRNALSGAGQPASASETGLRRPGELSQAEQLEQLRQERQRSAEAEEGPEPLVPVLKSEDWVVIEIDYQLPPRPIPPYLQALYSSAALGSGSAASAAQAAAAQAGAQNAN